MTCIHMNNAIVCVSPYGQLHVGNRYIMVENHEYLGPSFYTDRAMTKPYEPTGENDPVWAAFHDWLVKFRAKRMKARKAAKP